MPATAFITPGEAATFSDPARGPLGANETSEFAAAIGAVCEAMELHLHRQVVARATTKIFDGCSSRLRLPHVAPGVLTVTSVTEKGVPLTEGSGYLVYPDDGYLVRLSGANTAGTWAPGLQTVAVVFTAGVAADVASVPADLKLCAKIAVKFFGHMGWEDYGTKAEGGAWIRPDQFPRQCLWLMDPYKVVTA